MRRHPFPVPVQLCNHNFWEKRPLFEVSRDRTNSIRANAPKESCSHPPVQKNPPEMDKKYRFLGFFPMPLKYPILQQLPDQGFLSSVCKTSLNMTVKTEKAVLFVHFGPISVHNAGS